LPRIFPRDRIFPLSSLAEKGTLVLGILAAIMGGASLSLSMPEKISGDFPGEILQSGELPRIMELLRPSVLIGDTAFLEALYRDKAAPTAEGPLSRNLITRPLAQYLGGRELIKALGGNVRFFGFTGTPGEKLEKVLGRVHLPRGRIVPTGPSKAAPAGAPRGKVGRFREHQNQERGVTE
jgi:hypothetical protein